MTVSNQQAWETACCLPAEAIIASENPYLAWLALERFWNDGSPSGFRPLVKRTFAPEASPCTFKLPAAVVPRNDVTTTFGAQLAEMGNRTPSEDDPIDFHFHPALNPSVLWSCPMELSENRLDASPTASVRTVANLTEHGRIEYFVKLHFPSLLGRFERSLQLHKWAASLERSRLFKEAYQDKRMEWSFLEEFSGQFYSGSNSNSAFGNIFRSSFPFGHEEDNSFLIIPAFSLFAKPHVGTTSIIQAIRVKHGWTVDECLEHFAISTIDMYFELWLDFGLMPELNAQNLLFLYDMNDGKIMPVVRDMQDTYVDQEIIHRPYCITYKCISGGDEITQARRSFSFDFKLGEYFLHPLIKSLSIRSKSDDLDRGLLWRLREHIAEKIKGTACLPEGATYFYPRQLKGKDLRLQRGPKPIFRD